MFENMYNMCFQLTFINILKYINVTHLRAPAIKNKKIVISFPDKRPKRHFNW